LATGLVATTDITDATPAAFIAHQPSRQLRQEIAAELVGSGVDVFIGAGREHFNNRKDGRDLLAELKKKGYKTFYSIDSLAKTSVGKIAGLLEENRYSVRGDQLSRSATTAIQVLNKNQKGFFLMIEGSKIDNGGHDNDLNYVIEEMLDFDRTLGKVLDFAEKDGSTLVIVTADHETGGLTLTAGDIGSGRVEGKFSTGSHTAVMVPVFAFGPGAEEFGGIYDNNLLYTKMMKAFNFSGF
jgi:alkaline phosphatase